MTPKPVRLFKCTEDKPKKSYLGRSLKKHPSDTKASVPIRRHQRCGPPALGAPATQKTDSALTALEANNISNALISQPRSSQLWTQTLCHLSPRERFQVLHEVLLLVSRFDTPSLTMDIVERFKECKTPRAYILELCEGLGTPESNLFGSWELRNNIANILVEEYTRDQISTEETVALVKSLQLSSSFFEKGLSAPSMSSLRLAHHILEAKRCHIDEVRHLLSKPLSPDEKHNLYAIILENSSSYNEDILRSAARICRGQAAVNDGLEEKASVMDMSDSCSRFSDGMSAMLQPGPASETPTTKLRRVLRDFVLFGRMSKQEVLKDHVLHEILSQLNQSCGGWVHEGEDMIAANVFQIMERLQCEPERITPFLQLSRDATQEVLRLLKWFNKEHLRHLVLPTVRIHLHAAATQSSMKDKRYHAPEDRLGIILLGVFGCTDGEVEALLNAVNIEGESIPVTASIVTRTKKEYNYVLGRRNEINVDRLFSAQLDRINHILSTTSQTQKAQQKQTLRQFRKQDLKLRGYVYDAVVLYYSLKCVSPALTPTDVAARVSAGCLTELFSEVEESRFCEQFNQDVSLCYRAVKPLMEDFKRIHKRRKSSTQVSMSCGEPPVEELSSRQRLLNASRPRLEEEEATCEEVPEDMDIDSLETTANSQEKYEQRRDNISAAAQREHQRRQATSLMQGIGDGKRRMVAYTTYPDAATSTSDTTLSRPRFLPPPTIARVPRRSSATSIVSFNDGESQRRTRILR